MSKVIKLGIGGNHNDGKDSCVATVIVTMIIIIRKHLEKEDLRQAVRQTNK